jgi:hypothetical protein
VRSSNLSGSGRHLSRTKVFTAQPASAQQFKEYTAIPSALNFCSLQFSIGSKISEGNTDSAGTEAINQQFSEQRAEGVRGYLTQQSVAESSTTVTGFGKTRPIASNDSSEGRQLNRRVELIVSGKVRGTKIVSLSLQPVVAVTSPQ